MTPKLRYSLPLVLVVVLASGTIGCDGEEQTENGEETSQDEASDTDDAPAQPEGVASSEFVDHLSADTEMALSVGHLSQLRDAPDNLLDSRHIDDNTSQQWRQQWNEIRQAIGDDIGLDFFDPELLDHWGVDPDGRLFLGGVDLDPVVCVGVDDRDAFNQFAVDVVAGDLLDIEAPEHQEVDADDNTIHTIGSPMSWYFDNDSSCLAFQTGEQTSQDTLTAFIAGPDDGDALVDTEGFQRFADSQLNEGLVSMYSGHSDFFEALLGPGAPQGPMSMFSDAFTGHAAAITVEDDVAKLRGWGGLSDAQLQVVQNSTTPDHSFDWSRFGTDNTTAALRLSINPEVLWQQFTTMAGDHFQNMADDAFDQAADVSDGEVDAEEQVIGNLSGHIGLFIYDLAEPEALMGDDVPDLNEDIEGLLAIHFIDQEPLDEMVAGLEEVDLQEVPTNFEHRSIGDDDAINILDFQDVGVRLFHHDALLVLATDAMTDERVASLIRGELDDQLLSDTGLGAALSQDVFNGLYVGNSAWPLLEMELPDASTHFQEALVSLDATDGGVTFGADFLPAGSALFGLAHGFQVDRDQQAGSPAEDIEVPEPPAQ